MLVKAGEDRGTARLACDSFAVGDGWAVAFKMESHNHPSAIEPFQGAATGVGGIIRDIFTMGARPVFSLDSLRFGPIHGDRCSDAQKPARSVPPQSERRIDLRSIRETHGHLSIHAAPH